MNDGFIAFISNEQYTALLLHKEIKSELKAMAKERNGSISDVIKDLVLKRRKNRESMK
jgi:predicted CopG family antitoxin